ncbi:Fe-ARD 1 [Coprinopsis marcescibilis]|uniref:Acireductone dioxygenase n=1 Tax=Coprinopsis marcescibilis TaxID=230819 RepID=A0A5C3KYW0_COPMA|nr:Fe-ARD 1 [Coprinopsis marcescibilis]
MRAYYFDNIPGDQRLAHDYVPSRPVPEPLLKKLGVSYWEIPIDGYLPKLDAVAEERGYKNRDHITVSKDGLGDLYEEKLKSFFSEHLHEDEEIRYVVDGSGFFDIRESPSEEWIRISVVPGDLLIIPAGIYHRFTLDENNYIKAIRLFQDEPKWVPYNRNDETEHNAHRLTYLRTIGVGA